jgi:RNA polymerase-binding protein DksA
VDKKEVESFRQMLLELRRRLAEHISQMQSDALREPNANVSELSDMPLEHLADRGTDNYARDMIISILQNSDAELCDIDAALAKIDEGDYGTCEACEESISRDRLQALPFARLCIDCKRAEEANSRG